MRRSEIQGSQRLRRLLESICDGDCSFSLPFFKNIRAADQRFLRHGRFRRPARLSTSAVMAPPASRKASMSPAIFSPLSASTRYSAARLRPSDDAPSAPPAIVLSYAYWVRAFGADRSAVGRTVRLNNTAATIVGVAEPHFTNLTPGKTQDFFMPFSLADRVRGEHWGRDDRLSDPGDWWSSCSADSSPAFRSSQAQAAATTIFRNETTAWRNPVFERSDAPAIKLLPAARA